MKWRRIPSIAIVPTWSAIKVSHHDVFEASCMISGRVLHNVANVT